MKSRNRISAVCIGALLVLSHPAVSWAAFVDLSTFVTEDYVTGDGPSNWVIDSTTNTQVTQTLNSDPSIFRSGGSINVANKQIKGGFLVTGLDDDSVGFVFGYQNRGQMYLFGWKKAPQQPLLQGMYLSLIDTGSPTVDPSIDDFYNTGSNTTANTILRENDLSWERGVNYSFELNFAPGVFDLTILNGSTVLETWTVNDGTYSDGDFGFFNASQPNVTYGNLEVVPIPPALWLFGSGLDGLSGVARRRADA